jgi:DNA repair protein RecO (recombination protein O)
MMRLTTEAILLRSVDYGESDRIVHLLTPGAGRLTVIAKGARRSVKRFPGTLDLFNHLRIAVTRRRRTGMGFLDQAVLISPFLELRTVPTRYAMASYLLELMGRMAPEDGARPDTHRIFSFMLAALTSLEEIIPDLRMRILLELRALDALGLRPELRVCVRCGAEPERRAGFHVADGGVICDTCSGAGAEGVLPVHVGTLRVLQQALDYPIGHLGRLVFGSDALAEAEHLLFRFQRFHVGLELRSEPFLEESLRSLTPPMP